MTTVLLHGYYDYRLVALSVFIATLAGYGALDLAGRITTARGPAQLIWLRGGATAIGNGIWAMHYIGMEAIRLPAMCMYSLWLGALSTALSIAISTAALHLMFSLREQVTPWSLRKLCSALVMGLAIPVIRDGSGKIVGASKIARDITERKYLERQLHQSQKMEAIGQLTGAIAHDFNNLLGIILGNLDLLELLLENDEEALKRVQTAQTAAVRGADLIRRLMAFSSNVELTATATSLNDSVRNLIDWAPMLGPDIKSQRNSMDRCCISHINEPNSPPLFAP